MPIPDFSETEQKLVSALLIKRYAKLVPLQLADSELQLDARSRMLTLCPTIYWSERGAQFVVCKVADDRYRSQFFYSEAEQFGTGRDVYDDLKDCVVTLLQVQSDHERQLANVSVTATKADTDTDYHGPMVI
ncbi:MAG: hypothetical protein A3H31_08570 [Gallionellales bacterium RIFCSPLOWO2_02_FULL_57_47]|nr:MAG: hypothetical protein A3H31_08570 [Gallionellales bacterium RIFCSPLOWO2_02_FULL_57_47]OGT13071.1 MAG: hypothetical protein A3J49_08160 [Gallionellales bacterium RIFCSPHIGHO2_02_FULL_57_16]